MKRLLGVLVLMLMVALTAQVISAEDDKDEVDPKAIKKAMKTAMKDGLLKKVAKGEGSAEDKVLLLGLFTAMSKVDPPKGEHKDWEKRTKALVDAAQAAVEGKEGAGAALGKAANCKECHGAHKPAKK